MDQNTQLARALSEGLGMHIGPESAALVLGMHRLEKAQGMGEIFSMEEAAAGAGLSHLLALAALPDCEAAGLLKRHELNTEIYLTLEAEGRSQIMLMKYSGK
jgi:hypothetical protein